jgi:osmotically-inducible protein OsmY
MNTDAQLQQDVIAELKWEPSVHAARIGVEVQDGVVTLAGDVGSYAEMWDAERAAQRVSGVKALAVEIEVKMPSLGQRADGDIARSAQNVIDWMTQLPVDAIKVMVEGGWVTLSGAVEWQYQKQAATDGVRYLLGVTGVSDQIAIQPRLTPLEAKHDLQAGIEAALLRRAKSDACTIGVEVRGDEVTLTGTVHGWPERDAAMHSAWAAPGVRKVVDRMTLVY